MSLRAVATPLDAPLVAPVPRDGGIDAALVDALVPAPGLDDVLARLRAPDALVVTTGQQPGLFTGPLYTVYKALSAAAVAAELERSWGRPVVPVFWVAGDDHDFAEASEAAWLSADGSLATAALPARPPEAPLTPMYRQPLGAGIVAALDTVSASLPPSEFRDASLDWLRRHYRADATVAAAFAGALAELLAPAGVVCLESSHPAVKRAAAPHIVRALEAASELDRTLAASAEAVRASGREPAVAAGDGATLVMLEGAAGRDRLVLDGEHFVTRRGRERLSLPALEGIAKADPGRLSPNVLLRPVVESALLPTVAYLAGPGELGYLELTGPVYDRLDVPRQLPTPRWSGVVVEPRVDRVLSKFDLTLDELLEPPGQLEARLARSQLPAEATQALVALRGAIESNYEVLGRAAEGIDPTLARPVQAARHQALSGSQEVEKKLVQHLKRRQETEMGQIARARTAVRPNGRPQERTLTAVSFLARYGPAFVPTVGDAIGRWYASALEGAPHPA